MIRAPITCFMVTLLGLRVPVLLFFPWPMARQGKLGLGEAVKVALTVPPDSINFWAEHFGKEDIDFEGPYDTFGQQAIGFKDPDRLQLELVFDEQAGELPGWNSSTVAAEYSIRGFWGTTLRLKETTPTAEVLKDVFGFQEGGTAGKARRYTTDAPIGGLVIIEEGEEKPSANGRGIIHHVAYRAKDEGEQRAMRKKVMEMGLMPSEVIDRHWFRSVYFQSPGGGVV